jgi:hypothetical protein
MEKKEIDQLEIADRDMVHAGRAFTSPPELPELPTGFVDKGSLVCFVAGVSTQAQSDVLNSTLLAQLVADKKFDREKAVDQWYKEYTTVLGRIGWVVQGFEFERYEASAVKFTMDEVVLEIAAAALTSQGAAVVAATLDALRKLPKSDGRLSLFDMASHSAGRGNFQISVCTEADGAVAMQNMAFTFETSDNVTQVLFFQFSSQNTRFHKAAQAQTLNSALYAQYRESIVAKLGKSVTDFIADLDI